MFHSTDEANDKEMEYANKIFTRKYSSICVLLITTCFPELTFTILEELRQNRFQKMIFIKILSKTIL